MNMEKSRFSRKVLSLSLAAALVAGAVSSTAVFAASAKPVDPADYQLADSIQGGAILHCFDWKYTDITAELPHIAQAGFTSVQTSPAQASEGTGPWYWLYQPLSFAVGTNDLGTKEELQELCDEAEKYGINVIVDVVANHLADNHENIQEDLKADKYWHTQGSSINYNDRQSITHGDLGMVDLNSEDEYVQKVVSDYVQELKGMGVDGIRWDAAKHIGLPSEGCDFWPNVLDEDMYNYGEILSKPVNGDCREEMQEYTEYMSVTDDEYGNSVLRIMRKGTIDLPELSEWVFSAIPPEKLVWWGESHDTYSNGEGSGSNGATQNEVDRAYAVVAAQGGAAPLYLSRPEATAKDSIRSGVKGSVHFTSPEIAAVNHFHNAFSDDSQYSVIPDEDDNALGIYRNGGIVIVMGTNGGGTVSMMNDVDVEENPMVPVGTYTDEITGNEFVVTKDTISGTVGESGIAVVYRSAFSNRVEADVETGTQFQGTLKVTLHTVGEVQDAAAVITAGETEKTVSFADGDVLELGSECDEGDICVTLTGKTADGKTCSAYYVYTKLKDREMPEVQPGGIVFDNTQTGWKAVSIYVYDEITTKDTITNGGWPGELMTDCGEDYFSYQLPEQFESCEHIMVIFSDGGKDQIPGAMQAGMTMAYTDKKLYDGNKWVDYPQKPEPKPEPQPEPKPEPQPEPQPEPKPEPQPEPQPEPKPEPQPEPKPEPTPVPTDDDKKSDAEDSDKHAVVPTSDSTSAFAVLALTVLSAGVIAVAMGKKKHEN